MEGKQEDGSNIISIIHRIMRLEESVRDHISTNRYQKDLLKNLSNWNQICSSLDAIGDTLYSFVDYIESDYPKSTGLKYIFTYGVLQALFIQQDAMKHLSQALDVPYEASDVLLKIRAIRNASIGHPTKNHEKKSIYYNYVSRMTLHKWGFELMRSSDEDRVSFVDVDLASIMLDQVVEIEKSYKVLAEKLREADKMHKEKHRDNLVSDIFHSGMGYLFEKVFQGVHSPSDGNRSFGLSMLKSIQETYEKFEKALEDRNELNDYTKFDLDEYKHALSVLSGYLSGDGGRLLESDARIYCFYIQKQHKHFVELAQEVDEEYRQDE